MVVVLLLLQSRLRREEIQSKYGGEVSVFLARRMRFAGV